MRRLFSLMRIILVIAAVAPIAYIVIIAICFMGGQPQNFFITLNDPVLVGIRSTSFTLFIIITTLFLIYFGLLFKGHGYAEWKIQQELEKTSIIWPWNSLTGFVLFYWIIQVLLIEVIALLGVLLSLAFGVEGFVILWACFAFISFSLIENRRTIWEKNIHKFSATQNQWASLISQNIRYADHCFILKEQVIGIRFNSYLRFDTFDHLASYGYLPAKWIYLEFSDYAIIRPSKDPKTFIKILKERLLESGEHVKITSSKHIHDHVKRNRRDNLVRILSLFIISTTLGLLALFWLNLPIGFLYLW